MRNNFNGGIRITVVPWPVKPTERGIPVYHPNFFKWWYDVIGKHSLLKIMILRVQISLPLPIYYTLTAS